MFANRRGTASGGTASVIMDETEMQTQLIKASARIVLAVVAVLCGTFFWFWPSKSAVVKQLITRDRRSVVKYRGPAPQAAVDRALQAAIHAPNHFLNEPWRFRLLGPETIKKIIALNEGKKELFEGVPGWLMVSIVPTAGDTKWNVKALEDHAACACAVQKCAPPPCRAPPVSLAASPQPLESRRRLPASCCHWRRRGARASG